MIKRKLHVKQKNLHKIESPVKGKCGTIETPVCYNQR